MKNVNLIAAFDVMNGKSKQVETVWPDLEVVKDYRWLHFDLYEPRTKPWAKQHLPEIATHALLQSETRLRCERFEDGLILNLRGVNLNPESDPEDMVSLRMWMIKDAIGSARV